MLDIASEATVSWLGSRLRREVRRLFQLAGYDVASIAKQNEEAQRIARQSWRWLDTLGIGTLIDIGANTGQFARLFLDVRPGCLVYSFEPLRDCYEELQQAMAAQTGFTAFNVALGEADGVATFFRSQFSPSSSLLAMGEQHKLLFPYTRNVTPEMVTVRRLDSFIHELAINGGLLVKIDVQGAEAQIIEGGRIFLSQAAAVLAEVGYLPLYEGQATPRELLGLLDDLGFAFVGVVDQYSRPSDSLPVYGDALFVRRSALAQTRQISDPWPTTPAAGSRTPHPGAQFDLGPRGTP
jgi:FkbM family methyltransferase